MSQLCLSFRTEIHVHHLQEGVCVHVCVCVCVCDGMLVPVSRLWDGLSLVPLAGITWSVPDDYTTGQDRCEREYVKPFVCPQALLY